LVIHSTGGCARVLPSMGQLVTVVVFPKCAACEICTQAVADRTLEGVLVCESCAEILARPEPAYVHEERPAHVSGPSLDEMVDALVRPAP
jgi:ribosomal protein L37AE/L43A